MLYGKEEEYRKCVERRMEVKGEKNFGTTEVEEMDEPNSTRTEKTEIVGKVNGAFTNIVGRS